MVLSPPIPEAQWLDRFARLIGQLLPHLCPADADRCARVIYLEAADLSPEEAAQSFAEKNRPRDADAAP